MSYARLPLRHLLWVDAVTCAVTGLLLVAGSGFIAQLTGIPDYLLSYAGIALLPIAVFMALTAVQRPVSTFSATVVIIGNVLWAFGSVLLLVMPWISPNVLGSAFLAVQAAIVLLLAWLEWRALGSETLATAA
jgi:hypothetical protein